MKLEIFNFRQIFYALLVFCVISENIGQLYADERPQNEAALSCIQRNIEEKNITNDDLKSFLRIQSELTLHRLALQYLKHLNVTKKSDPLKLEDQILKLMEERKNEKNFDVIFEKIKKSKGRRKFLSEAFLAFPDLFSKTDVQKDLNDSPLVMHEEDFILLGMVATASPKNIFSSNITSSNSILDFTKIIDSSYRTVNLNKFSNEQIELEIKRVEDLIKTKKNKIKENVISILQKTDCHSFYESECIDCKESKRVNADPFILDLMNLTSKNKETLTEQLARYGEVWLSVGYKGKEKLTEKSEELDKKEIEATESEDEFKKSLEDENETSKKIAKKITKNKNKIITEKDEDVVVKKRDIKDGPRFTKNLFVKKSNDLNYPLTYMEYPGVVVRESLKNGYNIDKDFSNEKDSEFLMHWANAIIRKDQVFSYRGKTYSAVKKNKIKDILPGDLVSDEELLQSFSTRRIISGYFGNQNQKHEKILAAANQKLTYIYDGNIYKVDGYNNTKISPREAFKSAFHFTPTVKVSNEYLLIRSNAKLNNELTFKMGDDVFRTATGRKVGSLIEKEFEKKNLVNVTYNEIREKEDKINNLSTRNEKLEAYKKYFPSGVIPKNLGEADFYIKDGKINKFTSKENEELFKNKSECFHPILKITSLDTEVPFDVSQKFLNKLKTEKGELLSLYAREGVDGSKAVYLSDEDYNELVQISYGILKNESYRGDFWRNVKDWTPDMGVLLYKNIRHFIFGTRVDERRSEGLPQMKRVPNRITAKYGIDSKDLNDPEKAALAIFGFLVQSLEELKNRENKSDVLSKRITPLNRKDYLIYLYNTSRSGLKKDAKDVATPESNIYIQNIKKSKNLIQITEDKKALPISHLNTKCDGL